MKLFVKKIFFTLFLALIAFAANAKSDTTIVSLDTYNRLTGEFKNCTAFSVDFDLNNMSYGSLTFNDFLIFCKGSYNYEPEFINILFKKWEETFYSQPQFVRPNEATTPFRIHIKVTDINERAGMKATALVTYKDSINYSLINLSVENGRWNTFDKLLMEKAEDQVKLLKKGLKTTAPNLIIKDKDAKKAKTKKAKVKRTKQEEIELMKERERQKWADHMYYQDQY